MRASTRASTLPAFLIATACSLTGCGGSDGDSKPAGGQGSARALFDDPRVQTAISEYAKQGGSCAWDPDASQPPDMQGHWEQVGCKVLASSDPGAVGKPCAAVFDVKDQSGTTATLVDYVAEEFPLIVTGKQDPSFAVLWFVVKNVAIIERITPDVTGWKFCSLNVHLDGSSNAGRWSVSEGNFDRT